MIRLDFGCGVKKLPEFIGIDLLNLPGIDCVADLTQSWPFASESVDDARASHFIEHLDGKQRVHFFNELYRVLKTGASCLVICPHWSHYVAYGDISHAWPAVSEYFFEYLNRDWRAKEAPHTDRKYVPWGFDCHFHYRMGFGFEEKYLRMDQSLLDNTYAPHYRDVVMELQFTVVKVR